MRAPPVSRGAAIRGIIFWIFAVFLYAPFLGMGVLAFQGSLGGLTFPFTGPSLYWLSDLVQPSQLIDFPPAIGRSVLLALGVAALTLTIPTTAALALRRRFVGSGLIFFLAVASLVLPSQLVSIGVSLLWRRLGLQPAWYGATVGAN